MDLQPAAVVVEADADAVAMAAAAAAAAAEPAAGDAGAAGPQLGPQVVAPPAFGALAHPAAEIANRVMTMGLRIAPAIIGMPSSRIVEFYACNGLQVVFAFKHRFGDVWFSWF